MLVIWGRPPDAATGVEAASPGAYDPGLVTPAAMAVGADSAAGPAATAPPIVLAAGGVMEIDAVIDPGRDAGTRVVVGFPPRPGDDGPSGDGATADPEAAAPVALVVTGSRVNLRAGPSTATAVRAALTAGSRAELIEALPNGWMHIRATETGMTGYMASDFLAEAG